MNTSVVCSVCGDVGLLLGEWCPLCDGFGYLDWLVMQEAQSESHKGRLLVRRLSRVCGDMLSSEEKKCIDDLILSKFQRKKKKISAAASDTSNASEFVACTVAVALAQRDCDSPGGASGPT